MQLVAPFTSNGCRCYVLIIDLCVIHAITGLFQSGCGHRYDGRLSSLQDCSLRASPYCRPVKSADIQAAAAAETDALVTRKVAAVGADPLWGPVRSRRTFIIAYRDDAHARRIAHQLRAQQGQVLSYIPEQNLLVSARREMALRVALEEGTELVSRLWW